MIVDNISNLKRYKGISPNLDNAIEYLISKDLGKIEGRVEISDSDVYVCKQNPILVSMDERPWENHFQYIDIHVALSGSEVLGYCNNAERFKWDNIDMEKDCEFSSSKIDAQYVCIKTGMCAIIWPQEPHKPNIGKGEYTKLVVKVKV